VARRAGLRRGATASPPPARLTYRASRARTERTAVEAASASDSLAAREAGVELAPSASDVSSLLRRVPPGTRLSEREQKAEQHLESPPAQLTTRLRQAPVGLDGSRRFTEGIAVVPTEGLALYRDDCDSSTRFARSE
jgi:hypothetical protein